MGPEKKRAAQTKENFGEGFVGPLFGPGKPPPRLAKGPGTWVVRTWDKLEKIFRGRVAQCYYNGPLRGGQWFKGKGFLYGAKVPPGLGHWPWGLGSN